MQRSRGYNLLMPPHQAQRAKMSGIRKNLFWKERQEGSGAVQFFPEIVFPAFGGTVFPAQPPRRLRCSKVERAGNESSFALCRLKLEEPMFRKMQDPWALTYSAKKTKDGKNSGIKVISSPESFLSFLRFPSSLPWEGKGDRGTRSKKERSLGNPP